MATAEKPATEAEGWWVDGVCRTERVPLDIEVEERSPVSPAPSLQAAVSFWQSRAMGEQSPASPAPSLQAAVSFWRSRAMDMTAEDHTPSSNHPRESSPISPAPSLPPAEFKLGPPEDPCSSHSVRDDGNSEPHHSIATRSTALNSTSTLSSTLLCSAQSLRSVSSSRAAEGCRPPPWEAFTGDGLSSELSAREVPSRPLGCLLGNSLCPKGASNSKPAPSLQQPRCTGDGWPWFGSLRDAPRGPVAAGPLQPLHRERLEGAAGHS